MLQPVGLQDLLLDAWIPLQLHSDHLGRIVQV